MKNYEEMAERVLERRDRYAARRKKIRKTASMAAGFCFLAVLGTGIWHAGILNNGSGVSAGDALAGETADSSAKQEPAGETADSSAKKEPAGENADSSASKKEPAGENADSSASKKEPAGDEFDGNSAGYYPPRSENVPPQSTEISEPDAMDMNAGGYRDNPAAAVQDAGSTGALAAYEPVWGGSYRNAAGKWVVLLTENTAENREKVFRLNPALTERNTVFKKADYSYSYLVDLMERLRKAELPSCVSSIGFREERNRIEVITTVEDADAAAEISAFDAVGGAIDIICLSDIRTDESIRK